MSILSALEEILSIGDKDLLHVKEIEVDKASFERLYVALESQRLYGINTAVERKYDSFTMNKAYTSAVVRKEGSRQALVDKIERLEARIAVHEEAWALIRQLEVIKNG